MSGGMLELEIHKLFKIELNNGSVVEIWLDQLIQSKPDD
jgi:hypothetical protein